MIDDNMAVDADGNPLAFSSDEVRRIVEQSMLDPNTQIVAVILQKGDDTMVQVFGPPSKELIGILDRAAKAYRRVLRGH